jgi:hypothetical protein
MEQALANEIKNLTLIYKKSPIGYFISAIFAQ